VELPIICEYKVVTIDSANSTPENNIAVLDTGLRMNVPAFVKAGDNIRINTVDSVYVDRIL
jgi:elongation factor P